MGSQLFRHQTAVAALVAHGHASAPDRSAGGADRPAVGAPQGGLGFNPGKPWEAAAAAAAVTAVHAKKMKEKKMKEKKMKMSSPLSPDAFAFDGSEVARQTPY